MKLLLASEYFHPHWTGIAKAFLVLANDLQKQGHPVTVLTTQFDKKLPTIEQYSNIAIYRSPSQLKISRTYYSFSSLFDFVKLVVKNDHVIINSPHSNILFFTVLAKLVGKKVTIFHQGDLTLPRLTGSQLSHRLIEQIFDVLTIPAFFLADRISTYTKDYATHSRTMKYFMKKLFPYIPLTQLPTSNSQQTTRSHLPQTTDYRLLTTQYILIGFAGRFVEEKGFDILYHAMDQVVKEFPHAHFVFAGQKEMEYEPFYESQKKLFNSQKKYVTYLGLLDNKKLAAFYKSLDVFVVSSRSDCFPLTQMEAALAGVPVVCTDIPGARVLVRETGFGTLVKPNDADDLARGIIEVAGNRNHCIKYQKNISPFFKKYAKFVI